MKFRISENGQLEIWRKSKWLKQQCRPSTIPCNDYCSLFGEPEQTQDRGNGGEMKSITLLKLCKRTIACLKAEFQDLRK